MDSTRFWTRPSLPARATAPDQYGYSDRRARTAQLPGQADGPKQCGKCGMLFMFQHSCRASTTQCFKCKAFGHIARNCRTQICHTNRRQTDNSTKKSEKKQERDHRRLIQFRARKSACAMMPFYEVSNCDLPSCLPKFVNQPVKRATCTQVSRVTTALEHATSEADSLKAENEIFIKKNTFLVEELSFVNKLVHERYLETRDLADQLDTLNTEYLDVLDDRGQCDLRTVECQDAILKCKLLDHTLKETSDQMLQQDRPEWQSEDENVKTQVVQLLSKISLTLQMVIQNLDAQTPPRCNQNRGAQPSQWNGKNRVPHYNGEQLPQWNNHRRRPHRR